MPEIFSSTLTNIHPLFSEIDSIPSRPIHLIHSSVGGIERHNKHMNSKNAVLRDSATISFSGMILRTSLDAGFWHVFRGGLCSRLKASLLLSQSPSYASLFIQTQLDSKNKITFSSRCEFKPLLGPIHSLLQTSSLGSLGLSSLQNPPNSLSHFHTSDQPRTYIIQCEHTSIFIDCMLRLRQRSTADELRAIFHDLDTSSSACSPTGIKYASRKLIKTQKKPRSQIQPHKPQPAFLSCPTLMAVKWAEVTPRICAAFQRQNQVSTHHFLK